MRAHAADRGWIGTRTHDRGAGLRHDRLEAAALHLRDQPEMRQLDRAADAVGQRACHERGRRAARAAQHARAHSPFTSEQARWEHSRRDFIFTFVRNPYVRVLSAYLDKIAGSRDPAVWCPFAERHGLGEGEISFGQFLRLVASEAPETRDTHWRPQTLMIGVGFVPYDFVGTMETLRPTSRT